MRDRVKQPPVWDFRVFWMYGQLLRQGANVYQPSEYQRFENIFENNQQFTEAVLSVGATYPPESMLLFLPLGFWDIHTAYRFWYVLQSGCLLFSIELLRRLFFAESGVWGLALVALLIFSLQSSWNTIALGQMNFLVLLFLLLYWKDWGGGRAGVWLALAILVKLYVAVVFLFPLLRRCWRALAWAVISSLLVAVAALAALGPKTFFGYFVLHPATRLPGWVYTEHINQSLPAVVLRHAHNAKASEWLYVVIAIAAACVSGWLVYRLRRDDAEWGLGLVLALALMIYPGTLAHYTVVLLIPLLLIWANRERIPLGVWGSAGLIASVYFLIALFRGESVFAAMALTWLALAGICLRLTSATWTPLSQSAS
jgi:Glycosyltransferase family 87